MKVIILGSGPSGLFAAHAAKQRDAEVTIYSNGGKGSIQGAQWLQGSVPGINDRQEPEEVYFTKVGHEDGYAMKAYGEARAAASWESFVATAAKPAWPLLDAYDTLWKLYSDLIVDQKVRVTDIGEICAKADLVFCSISAKFLCNNLDHKFDWRDVVFTKEPIINVNNMIVYNGRTTDDWYRASCLFGHCTVEYSRECAPSWALQSDAQLKYPVTGYKPVRTDCNCHANWTNFVRIGRYGRWKRGVLVNHAYDQAMEKISDA